METLAFENRLRLLLSEYVSSTNTRTMTPVRRHILQILMFIYGKENLNESGAFTYSKDRNVADQQRKYVLFSYLFLEALLKKTITRTDLTTLQRMWDKHLLSLVNNGMESAAEKYERILHSSKDTIINIKRFQRYLSKCSAADTEERAENVPTSFSFRKSNLKERLAMPLRSFFGHGDPKDFFMIKFYD
uniref:Uncharacterized protein LOC111108984 n=1 Tax=Crassostrea virginica TaxID=6565 RepID=A0A8B8BCS7_CRAVI|nr:uncharacterized protein LOC111108984 [Crassostrea virginica]